MANRNKKPFLSKRKPLLYGAVFYTITGFYTLWERLLYRYVGANLEKLQRFNKGGELFTQKGVAGIVGMQAVGREAFF